MSERHDSGPAPHEGPTGFDAELELKPILKSGAWTIGVSAGAFVFVIGLYSYLARAERNADPAPSPIPEASVRQLPPEPRLQTTPEKDLAALRREQKSVLESYGWADRQAGVARIPIDRAIELTAERGLPRTSAAATPGTGTAPDGTGAPAVR